MRAIQKRTIVIYVLCLTAIYFFGVILVEWDSSPILVTDLPGKSFIVLLAIACGVLTILTAVIVVLSSTLLHLPSRAAAISLRSGQSMAYQLWIALLFSRSCHVWTHTIEAQQIINVGDQVLTLGAPITVNWTCVENCDGYRPATPHYLPFIRNDARLWNVSEACAPWFEEDVDSLIWTMTWETIFFAGLLVHLLTRAIFQDTSLSFLLVVDIISLLSTACLAFEPQTYYSLYNIGGVVRFLGLLHAIVPLESLVKSDYLKQLSGCAMTLKLLFVVLSSAAVMFVAEKPCEALQNECDAGFRSFGNTLYFVFVTLSTVGYGDMSPKTKMGKICIVFIIMASISYLPNLLSDVLEMCRQNPIHNRLDEMHADIRQVGFTMHGGTNRKKNSSNLRLRTRLRQRQFQKETKLCETLELQTLL